MYTIQDVSKKTGLTAHTLRYYEKEGLITGVERSQGGIRQYTDEDLERLGLIRCLKNTGMSIQEIARFVQLTHEGDHTLEEKSEIKYRPPGITGRPVLCYFAVLPDSVDHLLYAGLRLFVLIKEQGMLLDDGTAGLEPEEIQPGIIIRHTPGGDRVDDI